jgi:hypothetical protein
MLHDKEVNTFADFSVLMHACCCNYINIFAKDVNDICMLPLMYLLLYLLLILHWTVGLSLQRVFQEAERTSHAWWIENQRSKEFHNNDSGDFSYQTAPEPIANLDWLEFGQ